jgi:hypothetical protein
VDDEYAPNPNANLNDIVADSRTLAAVEELEKKTNEDPEEYNDLGLQQHMLLSPLLPCLIM